MSSSFVDVKCPKCGAEVDKPCRTKGKQQIVCGKRVRESLIKRGRP